MLIRIVKMTFQEDKIPQFLQLFDRINGNIQAFPGCLQINLLRDMDRPEIYFTYSIWENRQQLEQYRNSEMFRDTWKKVKNLFSKDAEAWSLAKHDPI